MDPPKSTQWQFVLISVSDLHACMPVVTEGHPYDLPAILCNALPNHKWIQQLTGVYHRLPLRKLIDVIGGGRDVETLWLCA